MCFTGDNTNTNFGGVLRRGKENIHCKLKKDFGRHIIGVGCGAHITHNSIQTGCEMLPIDFEALIVKIYKFFHIYTVRTEALKKFCFEAAEQYMPLVKHSSTRFLSLLPAMNRVIDMYEPLEKYFGTTEKVPTTISSFFSNPQGKFWLLFTANQLENFNSSIKMMERKNATSFESCFELTKLKEKLVNRQKFRFIPKEARDELSKKKENEQREMLEKVVEFYDSIVQYITLWESSFDGTTIFCWMTLLKAPNWEIVEKSYDFCCNKYGKDFNTIVNNSSLFDETTMMINYVDTNLHDWRIKNVTSEERWIQIFKHFVDNGNKLINLEKLVEFAFCLPGTSCEVERIFSILNLIWTSEKNFLLETVDSILSIQYNSDLSCTEFHEKIKNNVELLEKVKGSEKYQSKLKCSGKIKKILIFVFKSRQQT